LQRRKKRSINRNGVETVRITTRHGAFSLARVRLRDARGEVGGGCEQVSAPLQTLCRFLVNRLSFADSAYLLEQIQGRQAKKEDSLWRLVQRLSKQEDAAIAQKIAACQALPFPECAPVSDVYAPDTYEFVVLTDAIGVKAQKPTRKKAAPPNRQKQAKRHDTDVFVLPTPGGGQAYLCEGVSGTWSVVEAVEAFLREQWGGQPLSVVAITDGAKSIREDLQAVFGQGVRVILDWYHLCKRVYQNLSLAAHSAAQRKACEQVVLGHLWRGRVQEALQVLSRLPTKNALALSDLLGYLQKHAEEIIDYQRRKEAGKWIGSGAGEKAVDQVVGMRQKDRGMSWTKAGSRALALLKVAELNARQPVLT
jgi:uncharacterized protein UPF0236